MHTTSSKHVSVNEIGDPFKVIQELAFVFAAGKDVITVIASIHYMVISPCIGYSIWFKL